VNIGVLGGVIAIQGVDNDLGLLTGGTIVEIHQWLPMDFLLENGKIPSDLVHVPYGSRRTRPSHFMSDFHG
jgi:hypothetical protein